MVTPTVAGCPPSCLATVARVPITVATCTSPEWTRCRTLRYRRAWFRTMRAIGPMIDHSLRSAKTSHTTARSHATSYTHSYQAPERLTNPTICVSTHSKRTISEPPRSDPLPSSVPILTHGSLCIELFIFLKKKKCNPISQNTLS